MKDFLIREVLRIFTLGLLVLYNFRTELVDNLAVSG